MKAIWKYQIEIDDYVKVQMPQNSEILCVQMQQGKPCIWAMVDPEEKIMDEKLIAIFGTGHPIQELVSLRYIGTIQTHGGVLVFHVFERIS